MEITNLQTMSPGAASANGEMNELRRITATFREGDAGAKKIALQKTCEKFEAVFVRIILQQMRKSLSETNLFGKKDHAMRLYEEMMDETLADELGRSRGLGIAALLENQVGKLAEQEADAEDRAETAQVSSTEEFLLLHGRSLEKEPEHE
jgi:flagellar protein FlgJ